MWGGDLGFGKVPTKISLLTSFHWLCELANPSDGPGGLAPKKPERQPTYMPNVAARYRPAVVRMAIAADEYRNVQAVSTPMPGRPP